MVQTDGRDSGKSGNVIGEWFENRDAEYKAHREKFVDMLPDSVVGFVEKPSVDSFLEIGLSSLKHVPKQSASSRNSLQKAPICSPENPLFPVVVPFRRLCKGKNPFQEEESEEPPTEVEKNTQTAIDCTLLAVPGFIGGIAVADAMS